MKLAVRVGHPGPIEPLNVSALCVLNLGSVFDCKSFAFAYDVEEEDRAWRHQCADQT